MSEEKIIQHSQKAVDLLKNRSKAFKEKILEFLEEIVIIVVAVSLTLAFHNWNDRRKEKEIARNFLVGIRQDLLKTASDLQYNVKDYQSTVDYYDTVWKQINSHKLNAGWIDSNSGSLINTSYFTYDGSRFEGFKSSGNLRLITNGWKTLINTSARKPRSIRPGSSMSPDSSMTPGCAIISSITGYISAKRKDKKQTWPKV
jgi:hypothetical protein